MLGIETMRALVNTVYRRAIFGVDIGFYIYIGRMLCALLDFTQIRRVYPNTMTTILTAETIDTLCLGTLDP